ncbi:TrmB family transcriptional regulator [Thermoplasmatales archaeon ex4484_6]|nr:MAG: TrmB family transcriptional regulator [Thermoplasmatales archaeon ex4484_6]RLF68388.1 MAG: TrmB family transcriptional regulator [Thermoplasmata archaeon]
MNRSETMDVKAFPKIGANCENAVRCFFDLNQQDLRVYRELLENGPGTAQEIGERIGRDRSTAYRSASKLVANHLAVKLVKNRGGGGIYHVYQAVDPFQVQTLLKEAIEEWYNEVMNVVERTAGELRG